MFKDTSAALNLVESLPPVEALRQRLAGFTKPAWWDNPEAETTKSEGDLRIILKSFLEGKLKRRVLNKNSSGMHYYSTKNDGTELWLFKDNPSVKLNVCVAVKLGGAFIGNASSIQAIRYSLGKNKNRPKLNWLDGEQRIQRILAEVMPMVPFRMLKENRLDLSTFQLVDKGNAEHFDFRRSRGPVHFMGAMVFKLSIRARSQELMGRKEEYFLFDADRNDIALKVFNPFLSKLPAPVTTVAQAYDSLKPQEVRDAERFLKAPCPRQGEWFFIPVHGNFTPSRDPRNPLRHQEAILQSKRNRPHYVSKLSEEGYVKGRVWHGGREHKDIELEGWHKPVPNTAIESFKITGGID